MRVLVTGGGGFLGQSIVRQLVERGDEVRTLARRRYTELDRLRVESVQGDLRDAHAVDAACRGMDLVIHTAAVAGLWGTWKHYYDTNTVGTQNVIRACRDQHVRGLVYTSSPSVTFDGSDQLGVDESVPYAERWLCHYPHSKALAERAVLAANGVGGVLTCSLRPHLIWGPGDPHLVPRLIQRARQGRLRRIGDGANRIDTVYVDDAARAHLLAADRLLDRGRPAGRVYFITAGQPVRCWEWIDRILERAGLPAVRRSVSFRTAWLAGQALEAAYRLLRLRGDPPMTRFLAAQLARSHFFNIHRARQDLDYHPQIDHDLAMERLANWLASR